MLAKWIMILSQGRLNSMQFRKRKSTMLIISSDFSPVYEMHMLIINVTHKERLHWNTKGRLMQCMGFSLMLRQQKLLPILLKFKTFQNLLKLAFDTDFVKSYLWDLIVKLRNKNMKVIELPKVQTQWRTHSCGSNYPLILHILYLSTEKKPQLLL